MNDTEGYTPWHGGERTTDKPVDVIFFDCPNGYRKDPKKLRWSHLGLKDDITHYRESKKKA